MRLLLLLALLPISAVAQVPTGEHVILCGGPALGRWESLRGEPHDYFWGNFIRASTLRMAEIRRTDGVDAKLVWIVYRPAHLARGLEEDKPLIRYIEDNATQRRCELT